MRTGASSMVPTVTSRPRSAARRSTLRIKVSRWRTAVVANMARPLGGEGGPRTSRRPVRNWAATAATAAVHRGGRPGHVLAEAAQVSGPTARRQARDLGCWPFPPCSPREERAATKGCGGKTGGLRSGTFAPSARRIFPPQCCRPRPPRRCAGFFVRAGYRRHRAQKRRGDGPATKASARKPRKPWPAALRQRCRFDPPI